MDVNTNIAPEKPLTITAPADADAVGISLSYSAYFGGGMDTSLDFVYFLKGKDAGGLFLYKNIGGGTGLDGGISVSGFYAKFNPEIKDQSQFNAEGFAGYYASYSGGFTIGKYSLGGAISWSNEQNLKGDLFPSYRNRLPNWTNYGISPLSAGLRFGAKISWGNSTLIKTIFTP